jgi:hypothetical protein
LEKQGLVNRWQDRATRRIEYGRAQKVGPLHLLAITAAFEHCTAVFADGTLRYGSWFDAAEPRMCTLWRWHAAEETEHRAVAFDLYQALGGNYRWRIRWYLYVLVLFAVDATRQTIHNLWRDGSLFKPGTWWGAATFLLGKDGMVWRCTRPLLQYFRRDFHPNHEYLQPAAQTLAGEWLSPCGQLSRRALAVRADGSQRETRRPPAHAAPLAVKRRNRSGQQGFTDNHLRTNWRSNADWPCSTECRSWPT